MFEPINPYIMIQMHCTNIETVTVNTCIHYMYTLVSKIKQKYDHIIVINSKLLLNQSSSDMKIKTMHMAKQMVSNFWWKDSFKLFKKNCFLNLFFFFCQQGNTWYMYMYTHGWHVCKVHVHIHVWWLREASQIGQSSYSYYVKKQFKTQRGRIPTDPAILATIGHRFRAKRPDVTLIECTCYNTCTLYNSACL